MSLVVPPAWCLPPRVVSCVPPSISASHHAPFIFSFHPLSCAQRYCLPSPHIALPLIALVHCVVPRGASLIRQYLMSLILCCVSTVLLPLLPQHVKLIVVLLFPPLKLHPTHLVVVHHHAGKKVTPQAKGPGHLSPLNLIVVLTLHPPELPPPSPCHGQLSCRSNQSDLRNLPIGSEKRANVVPPFLWKKRRQYRCRPLSPLVYATQKAL
jgi:hypothetical protein